MSVIVYFCCALDVLPSKPVRSGWADANRGNFFSRLSEFFLVSNIFGTFFAVFPIVSDTGLGGNTERRDVLLYLCLMVVIF